MRFLHTSDWHIGALDSDHSLEEDQKYFIDDICRIITEQNIDAVLLAGDVYDRASVAGEYIKLYDYAMTRLCHELKKKVIMIAGNHDGPDRIENCSNLLKGAGLYVLGTLKREPEIVSLDDTDVYLLPWITEERVKSVYPEHRDEIKSLTDAYMIVTDEMRRTFVPGKKHFVVSHAFITDAELSDSDHAAIIGFATQVPASVFDGFDYVALGHIHKPQTVKEYIRYSGTPMPYSFGKEEDQEKSVTIIDSSTMEMEVVPLKVLHKRKTLKGTFDELINYHEDPDIQNGYVRLEVTDIYVGLEAISQLKAIFPNYLEISGKSYEGEDSKINLSMEDFEKLESDPIEIFRHFCEDEIGENPDEHLIALFTEAMNDVQEARS